MWRDREKAWQRNAGRHRVAVQRFLEAGAALSPARWRAPIGEGKWTPGQITQHLIQTYEALIRELRTGEGLPLRTGWWLRQLLRLVVLRPVMWTRRLPPGATAARELLPGDVDTGQLETLDRLREVAARFDAELQARRHDEGLRLTHHYFGSVDAVSGLDFVAVHTEHHGRQLTRLLERRAGRG